MHEDYYHALSVSVDDGYELHLIWPPNSCFLNNLDAGLRACQANMAIEPVFNEYKAVPYMCSYFSKSEGKCWFAMNQGAGEFFDTKVDQFNSMKNILKVYTSYRKCSVQEAVYHILPELHLRRVFPGVQFVNTNLPEERSKILQTEEKLSSLPDDSTDIFKRNNIDCYLEDDQSGFVMENVAYLILFALHNLLHIYILQYKPKIIKLANSNEKM